MKNYLHISLLFILLNSINAFSQFGFEDGTANAWTNYRGMTAGIPEASVNSGTLVLGSGALEVTSAGNDAFLNSLGVSLSSVSPNGGAHSLKMEDYQVGGNATIVSKTFTVTQQTALYVYHYAVILEDPGHSGRPFFKAEVTDASGNLLPCGKYEVIADNPASDGFSAVAGQGVGGPTTYWYKDWTYVAVNLENYIGQDVTVTYTVGDCSAGEHLGYAYIDETVSPLEATVANYCPGDPTITLVAPDGFLSYLWWTPTPVFDQTAVIANPDAIDSVWVEMQSELGNCPITMTVHLNNLPVAYPFFTNTQACAGNDIQFTNSTNTNGVTITNYLWDFGDGSTTSTDENPTHNYANPGTYSVNFQITTDSGCQSDTTIEIIVDCCVPQTTFDVNVDACGTQATFNYTGIADTTYNYIWNFGTGTIISGSGKGPIVVDFNNAGAYTVNLAVTNIINGVSCDTTYASQTITINSAMSFTIDKTDIVCFGDNNGTATVVNTGSVGLSSFNWNDSNNQVTQTATGLDVGIYNVTVTDINGCSSSGSIEINSLYPPMELNIIPVNVDCFGNSTGSTITNIAGGNPPYTFEWNNAYTNQNLTNVTAGNYTLTVQDVNKCTIYKSVTILQPQELKVSVNTDFFTCKNTNNTLIASVTGGTLNGGTYSYIWSTNSTNNEITVNVSNNSQYFVTVTDANNCTATTTSNILIYDDIQLTTSVSDDTVCPGNPILIDGNVIGGSSPVTITMNNNISSLPSNFYPTINDNNITITATDQCGSTATNIESVNLFPVPNINISSDIIQGCPPLVVNFNEGSNTNNAIYNWTFGENDNNYTGTNNPTHIFENSGIYDVSLELTTENGCKTQQTINNMITVFAQPEAMFEATPEVVSFINPQVEFTNYSTENYNNFWYFGDGNMSNLINPYHSYTQIGEYDVLLVTETEHGCIDSVKHHITVQNEFTLYIPTAFSPDGDGINDGFKAVGHGIDIDNYYIAVYDRWGEVIWSSTDLFEEWKGTAKNGNKTIQVGTYKWIVVCKDFNGVEHTKSGNVTIVR